MKDMNGIKIIGVDHGYGNIKTASCCFLSGVAAFDEKPPVGYDLLRYDGRYYLIGALHKTYCGVKVIDEDYYILTLAAVARELRQAELTDARVYLAVGLPLSWVTTQSAAFRDYLLKYDSADFTYRDIEYHVEFAGCEVFPQGFAAVADRLRDFPGHHMLCDIGNGTMNILHIKDGRPDATRMFTEECAPTGAEQRTEQMTPFGNSKNQFYNYNKESEDKKMKSIFRPHMKAVA